MRKLKAWNLEQGDGKAFGASFTLADDEYAQVRAHLMCPGDALYIVERDHATSPECSTSYASLAYDDCKPLIIEHPRSKVNVPGPGIFRVQRIVKDGEIQGMHIEANVQIHKVKPGVGILDSKGFGCEC